MKKAYLLIFILIFLIVSIPFASNNPDGLEKVVSTYEEQEGSSYWNGVMSDYSISSIQNSYLSTLASGVLGAIMIYIIVAMIGKIIESKKLE